MRKKLLILMPTFSKGGAERVISELSLHFPDTLEVVIAVFEKAISYPYKGRVESLEVPLSTIFFTRSFAFFKRLYRFKKLLKEERPDYVMSAGASANIMSILASKEAIVRVDMFISKGRRGFWGSIFKLLVRLLFRKAKKVIPVSNAIAYDLERTLGVPKRKMQVIYNPVDSKKISSLADRPVPKDFEGIFKYPVVATMGRLTKQKGQWHLIRAFAEFKKSVPSSKLIILGEGELRAYLEKMILDLGMQQDIFLLGWQENPFQFLGKAQLFVLPSLWEGLPDVLLEAMACGLPIASSDCRSGPREILAPSSDFRIQADKVYEAEFGILFSVGSENFESATEALSKQEQDMVEAMQLGLSKQGYFKERSLQRAKVFDINGIIKEWNSLFPV